MATKVRERAWSDLPIPPGELLAEEIAAIGMTQNELARRAGRPVQAINEIIHGKKAITDNTALDLEKVLGIPAHVWVNLESTYQLTLARNREREALSKQVEWLSYFPVSEMEKRRWIPVKADRGDRIRAVLAFLGVASVPAWRESLVGLRITGNGNYSEGALAVWLRKGELDGREIETAPYREEKFRKALSQLRSLTTERAEHLQFKMKQLCANAGIALVFTHELPRSGANGSARWLTEGKALIQLSLKWHWHDVFWFSFFHEACHILRHESRSIIIDGIDGDPQSENEADAFARDLLIAPEEWDRFSQREPLTKAMVLEFAKAIGIAPGIVVGRLQHEKRIPYSRWTDLKLRFAWKESQSHNS